jgi:hypothetical protein
VRVDLQRVIVVSGIFKQAVKGVEHFVGEEEEEFSAAPVSLHASKTYKIRATNLERPP